MDQRARMFKTLGCLIAAMVATSALLGWIDPSQPQQAKAISLEAANALARSVVNEGSVVHGQPWYAIEVTAGRATAAAGTVLTASSRGERCHFLVGLDGLPSRASRWPRQGGGDVGTRQRQGADAARAGLTVRIQVAQQKTGQPMSRAQWHAVCALVSALREKLEADGATLPVYLQEEWAAVYGVDPAEAIVEPEPAERTHHMLAGLTREHR
jgi:hypothetical protein